MQLAGTTGRNEPCPCGSGRKFKVCCQGKTAEKTKPRGRWILPLCVGAVVIAAVSKAVMDGSPQKPLSNAAATNLPPMALSRPAGMITPQPPGPVPPGKVWSAEHGHWHDLPGVGTTAAGNTSVRLQPQPPGPAPAGKVWSPEHGHWHDIAGGPAQATTTVVASSAETEKAEWRAPMLDPEDVAAEAPAPVETEAEPAGPVGE